jgi:hypothetical protein
MFTELTNQDLVSVNGGLNWGTVLGGAALVVGAAALVVGTGGLGFVAVPVILGAGTSGEIALAGLACAASGLGGAAIGYGATH